MPNGGIMPSCEVCKFSDWRSSEKFSDQETNWLKIFMRPLYMAAVKLGLLPYVRDNRKVSVTSTCKYYNFTVWGSLEHFCANLQGSDNNGLSRFVKKYHLEKGLMYAWFVFQYRDDEYPDIPQYHHELRALLDIKEYKKLTLNEKEKIYLDKKLAVREEIKSV